MLSWEFEARRGANARQHALVNVANAMRCSFVKGTLWLLFVLLRFGSFLIF